MQNTSTVRVERTDNNSWNMRWSRNIKTLSVICAILIVFIHTYNTEQYSIESGPTYWLEIIISQNICRIAVPFFFISSAFLLYKKHIHISAF